MIHKGIIICGLLILFGAGSHAQNGITLQQALDIATANNIPVKQTNLLMQTAELNAKQAKNNRLPVAQADVNYGISNGRSIDPFTNSYINQRLGSSNGSLTAVLPVYNGFRIKHQIKQTGYSFEAARMENQQAKDELRLSVILAFLQVLNNEDVLTLTKQQSVLTQKQVERLEQLNTEGAITPALLYDMKGQYASDKVAIVNATNELETSRLVLAQLMNIPYTNDMSIARDGIETSVQANTMNTADIYNAALEKLSVVKAADLRIKAASRGIKVAAADRYPELSLFGQLNTNYSSAARSFSATGVNDLTTDDYVVVNGNTIPVITKQTSYSSKKISYTEQVKNNLSTFVGLSLRIPIFNAFQTRTNVNLARIQESNARLVSEDTRTRLRQSIEEAHVGMTSAYNRYNILKEQVTAFEESFRSAEIRFNLGAINAVEYLIVKNNLDRANLNLTVARYEYLLRVKVLEFYEGK